MKSLRACKELGNRSNVKNDVFSLEKQRSSQEPVPNASMNSFGSFRQYDYLDYGLESIDSKEDNCEGLKVIVVEPDENAINSFLAIFSRLGLLNACSFFSDPEEALNMAITLL
jgi:hypothetical protein